MPKPKISESVSPARVALVLAAALLLAGCNLFKPSKKIAVPQPLTPLVEADLSKMFEEINRVAAVRSLNGRVDVQFLDNSFAECGIAEKYRTADGRVVVQRPGQVYLLIQLPVVGTKVAEMSSTGQRFWAAVYLGDAKYKRFVTGTNSAIYERLDSDGKGASPDCNGGGKKREEAMQRATVSALSSLRPQHLTEALLVPAVAGDDPNRVYAVSESFEEEPDMRPGAKPGGRVVRGYYILSELEPQGQGRARVLRRFWFDRVSALRLARVQSYDERGRLLTDVVYSNQQNFGEGGRYRLPAQIELTRPQDHYSIRIAFQDPGAVKVDQPYDPDIFVLKNTSGLQEVDLDAKRK
ncbi:MAG TPA: hypothetical protein VHU19_02670 [Pyrinomonadaceae bacterium]|jgi:hypothetical protein|nr:hypothetical protein [Pyrinomonadaceae bacterium]